MSEQPNQESQQRVNISDSVLESVQIGGIAGRDLKLTQIQGRVWLFNIFGTVQVPPAPLDAAKPLSRDEYKWRQVLLSKVQQFWIDGVLANSLHSKVLIELGLEERSDCVHSPIEGVEEFPSDTRQVLPDGTSATDIFEGIGAGRTLLILGEPGAGKTVTLLKLAESLLVRTSEDLSQPLPVVINLSSWARQRKDIDDWLAQELYETYNVSKSLGKDWIEKEQLILLLDGLDEVKAKYRNACVQALNQFIQDHGRTEIVVCSRIHDYEALSNKLSLRSALYVQPLAPEQIDGYLEQAGNSLETLKSVIKKYPDFKTFASSPLILSIMSLAYQDSCLGDFPQSVLSEAFRYSLFETYIKRMFQRRKAKQIYSNRKIRYWLFWLAQQMHHDSQPIFLIENLQPIWLKNELELNLYYFYCFLVFLLISGLIALLIFLMTSNLIIGFIYWLVSFLVSMPTNFLKTRIFILLSVLVFVPFFLG